jgi:hypothetical protein
MRELPYPYWRRSQKPSVYVTAKCYVCVPTCICAGQCIRKTKKSFLRKASTHVMILINTHTNQYLYQSILVPINTHTNQYLYQSIRDFLRLPSLKEAVVVVLFVVVPFRPCSAAHNARFRLRSAAHNALACPSRIFCPIHPPLYKLSQTIRPA